MAAADMPRAEVDIDIALVEALVRSQFPDLAGPPISLVACGWDNAMFRLGDDLVVRLPRRAVAIPLLLAEQRWLPGLADGLPLPVPAPVACGVPGEGYPWPWSICPYLPGTSVLAHLDGGGTLRDPVADARQLGAFHLALHRPAPADAPPNPWRGVPLTTRHERTLDQLAAIDGAVDVDAVRARWDAALAAPGWHGPPQWLHADPHPGNLVTDGKRITGVVDFGDMTGGDPATDVAAAWLVFDSAEARQAYRDVVGADDATWVRAQGWALAMAVAMLASSADNPPYERLGGRTVAAVLAEPS